VLDCLLAVCVCVCVRTAGNLASTRHKEEVAGSEGESVRRVLCLWTSRSERHVSVF